MNFNIPYGGNANFPGYTFKTGTLCSIESSTDTHAGSRTLTIPDNCIPVILAVDSGFAVSCPNSTIKLLNLIIDDGNGNNLFKATHKNATANIDAGKLVLSPFGNYLDKMEELDQINIPSIVFSITMDLPDTTFCDSVVFPAARVTAWLQKD